MSRVVVIGSGASGVQFARVALERGHQVVMLDVGTPAPAPVMPEANFDELMIQLPNAQDYFLGEDFQGALLPGNQGEYYGIPPSKDYVFETPPPARAVGSSGFEPLFSFAQGGLAQAWTAGCYPFNNDELESFPFGYDELGPYYDQVAQEIGINGADDDMARFFPVHDHLLPGLEFDEHSQLLARRYEKKRKALNRRGAYLGRSRSATLSHDQDGHRGCWNCGRCLWGCPSHSLYTPVRTLRQCQTHANFEYRSGLFVTHLLLDRQDRAEAAVAKQLATGETVVIEADTIVLAAGTLCSSRIFLESLLQNRHEIVKLHGLMDNRQILVPFLTLSMMGKPVRTDRFQYHQLMMALEGDRPADLVHCQITTLKSAVVHPIVQSIPLGLRGATRSFREIRSALGILNVNLPDTRRQGNYVTLQANEATGLDATGPAPLAIRYSPPADEPARLRSILKRARRCLWILGALAPPPMTHIRPMGASVHYAGVLPMCPDGGSLTTTANCRSRDISNLYLIDGSTFSSLPAKNLTFTLMANARRVANAAF